MKVIMRKMEKGGPVSRYRFGFEADAVETVYMMQILMLGMDNRKPDFDVIEACESLIDNPELFAGHTVGDSPVSTLLRDTARLIKSEEPLRSGLREAHAMMKGESNPFDMAFSDLELLVITDEKGITALMEADDKLSKEKAEVIWKGMTQIERVKLFVNKLLKDKGLL